MGNQKVPGLIILHSNDRTYGNDKLIKFKVEHVHTHLLHQSCNCWKQLLKNFGVRTP
jgi:hypothetical protein